MFIYFHKNKLRYEKGQLAPFFILILVVLILMAMVTVNLGKVAFIKTDSSNAADSGALAAGSVMANVFNGVASSNSQMEDFYWEFYAAVSISFGIALGYLISAMIQACPDPCGAQKPIGVVILTIKGIALSVIAFHIAQHYFYLSIREMAESEEIDDEGEVKGGRQQAIKLGHNFAFINSGIGSKLKEGSPEEIAEQAQKNNYRNEFSRFLDNLNYASKYTYAWEDGQEREHSVTTEVDIDAVDTFDLKVTVLPSLAVSGLLFSSSKLASAAQGLLVTACACQIKHLACLACCSHSNPGCCACAAVNLKCWKAFCAAAKAKMATVLGLMAAAWAGLLPGPIITDDDGYTALPFIICWIDDIEHNRLVRVDTTQHHEGTDLGLWKTKYPDTDSYSVVNFTGQGKIHASSEDDLRHDASITKTDRIGSP